MPDRDMQVGGRLHEKAEKLLASRGLRPGQYTAEDYVDAVAELRAQGITESAFDVVEPGTLEEQYVDAFVRLRLASLGKAEYTAEDIAAATVEAKRAVGGAVSQAVERREYQASLDRARDAMTMLNRRAQERVTGHAIEDGQLDPELAQALSDLKKLDEVQKRFGLEPATVTFADIDARVDTILHAGGFDGLFARNPEGDGAEPTTEAKIAAYRQAIEELGLPGDPVHEGAGT